MTRAFSMSLSFGATWLGNGSTRFRLWAPSQHRVEVVLRDGASVAMTRERDGWFAIDIHCGPGTRYCYRLDGGEMVPDPASRGQADDVHGFSLVIDPTVYRWRNRAWRGRPWREAVLYELHAGLLGGFMGVRAELPRLAALGVTAIELMPINDFPGRRNWGYDGTLPFAPDRAYGTPDELKELIDSAHDLQLMVFLDVVYNHFGPDGNYLGLYAPQFFRSDAATPWGAAIDFSQPAVRRFFSENALYWLSEYRFDGLRFDAAHAIADQAWLDEMAAEIRRTVEPGRHVHLVLEHDGNDAAHLRHGFDAQWNDDAHHALHVLLTGESDGYYGDYAQAPAEMLARCLAQGFAYQGEPSSYRGGKRRGTPSADLEPTSFVFFLQNHDQIGNRPFGDRLVSLVDPASLRAAIALQLLSPAIPLIFMGEEFMAGTPFQFFTDHREPLAQAVRDGRRREFARFSGFSADSVPDPNDRATFERSRPPRDGNDVLHCRLLALRNSRIAPHLAGARSLGAEVLGEAAVYARWRLGNGAELAIALNLADRACAFRAPASELLFASCDHPLANGELHPRCTVAFMAAPS
jgi:malto-oligosyltrehalose trehalohydrolase